MLIPTEPEADAKTWKDRVNPVAVRLAEPLARAVTHFHKVRIDGLEHLPAGPALLVGNHGLLGYETIAFFAEVHRRTGRLPRGLADRWFFRVPGLRDALVRLGGIHGDRENACGALSRGHLVVCYPGGAREVLKRGEHEKYKLQWGKSLGFARVAVLCGVPVVPFAAAGVDDTFDVVGSIAGSGELLMGHPKYDLPRLRGLGLLPRRVPFWFRVGAPIEPEGSDPGDERLVRRLHGRAWSAAQELLDGLRAEWKSRLVAGAPQELAA